MNKITPDGKFMIFLLSVMFVAVVLSAFIDSQFVEVLAGIIVSIAFVFFNSRMG